MKINVFRRHKDQATTAKRQLIEALHRRDTDAIGTLITQWQTILDKEKLTNIILNEVMTECDADSYNWFVQRFLGQLKYEKMQEQAQNHVFHILVNTGLEPGKDFSFGLNGEMMISDRAKQTLLKHLPQQHRALFAAQIQSYPVADPIVAIERQLGCAFFTNLTEIACQKVQLLSNAQAAAYLGVVIAGLVKRHPALQDVDFPTQFIVNVLQGLSQERATAILNDEKTNPQFDQLTILQDLLAALEESASDSIAETEGAMSLEQLKKIDLVWCGEHRIAEMLAVMYSD